MSPKKGATETFGTDVISCSTRVSPKKGATETFGTDVICCSTRVSPKKGATETFGTDVICCSCHPRKGRLKHLELTLFVVRVTQERGD